MIYGIIFITLACEISSQNIHWMKYIPFCKRTVKLICTPEYTQTYYWPTAKKIVCIIYVVLLPNANKQSRGFTPTLLISQ